MSVRETDLPGVGKKFVVDLSGDLELVIVIHLSGKREVFLNDDPEEDNKKLFEASDEVSRKIGSILEGAYFEPVSSEETEAKLGGEVFIEWYDIEENMNVAGREISELKLREETGATIIAIQRDDMCIGSIGPDTEIRSGDILVVVGTKEAQDKFKDALN
ncbi:MAG: K+/H+ antiporter YhaU, regulatory subunit KhtT [Candidatus Methanohalarchaeum thermophilum]|uniref:K+/H+ antiporter YhaU, regulatory subunit KhtT n=1 Tax=Methanohalarchaeum thermophilum TaxID=1903181 RepID=A0A1Q6DT17_METT1|nr:MAG: K+/H+ antiporter YhaU, regulatory subunit KhtT [Candidatus Methanohalarchaeum thermophilum]